MIRGAWSTSSTKTGRELRLFSMKKRRLGGDLTAAFHYLKGPTGKLGRDSLSGNIVTG